MSEYSFQFNQDRPQYLQIKKLLDQYKFIIQHQFQSNQLHLLQELQSKTIQLKQSIAYYKKQTSNQNIEKLITKKRHQKQSQRLQLQLHWRNLTQKYKKLQQQQKKIQQENKQNLFDIQNLQRKILQLQQANTNMTLKIQQLKKSAQNPSFLTQIKTSYISPYKFQKINCNTINSQTTKWKSMTKAPKTLTNFRLKLQNKKKPLIINRTNNQAELKINQRNSNINLNTGNLTQKKEQLINKQQSKIGTLELSNLYSYKQNGNNEKNKKFPFGKGQKWSQLMYYLKKPEVRDKIFDLLRKQIIRNG